MLIRSKRTALWFASAFAIPLLGVNAAFAGGFAIRENSAYGQGSSFAGIAAGGALSSMFWNPATITQQPGVNVEADATGIFPYAANRPGAGAALAGPPFNLGGTNNTSDDAFVPSGYASWQVSQRVWLGLSVNAPFGLSVSFPDLWAGRNYAGNTSLKTYSAAPTIAVKLNDWISFGAGMQIMYGKANLTSGLLPFPVPGAQAILGGDGWSYGFTAGVTVTPTPSTEIGLGWRSALDLKLDGNLTAQPVIAPASVTAVSTTLRLPDIVTLGVRQKLNEAWTLLGTVEWDNWSRIGRANVMGPGGPAAILGVPVTLPFQYKDGWFFSAGAEYAWDARTTLRGGVGYEISPITDSVRTPRLPDNDRIWTSVGLSYRVFDSLTFDLAYSHLFVANTSINITNTSNPWFIPGATAPYAGTVSSHVDIISFGLRYRFAPPTATPVLYRKG